MSDSISMPVWPPRIYLMGFMGSGKSALGAKLARRIDYQFLDLDALIVEREGQPVSGIFSTQGEAYFRKIETETLMETGSMKQTLIALGGGTPCYHHNMDWISGNGYSIYLNISVETLLGRLRRKRPGRPLLEALNDEELRDYIQDTLESRRPFYERADWVFEAEGKSPEETEAAFRQVLQNF